MPTNAWIPFGEGGPFTAENLQEIINRPRDHPGYVLTDDHISPWRGDDDYISPGRVDIELLALKLNDLTGAFRYAKQKTKAANALRDAKRNRGWSRSPPRA